MALLKLKKTLLPIAGNEWSLQVLFNAWGRWIKEGKIPYKGKQSLQSQQYFNPERASFSVRSSGEVFFSVLSLHSPLEKATVWWEGKAKVEYGGKIKILEERMRQNDY